MKISATKIGVVLAAALLATGCEEKEEPTPDKTTTPAPAKSDEKKTEAKDAKTAEDKAGADKPDTDEAKTDDAKEGEKKEEAKEGEKKEAPKDAKVDAKEGEKKEPEKKDGEAGSCGAGSCGSSAHVVPANPLFAPLAWLPKGAYAILHEITRHLLRRPVVGVAAVARTKDGRVLLVRRADTGTWALPGGTLEWGERLADALPREIEEETGAQWVRYERVTGVYSRPDRDPRFHAVTVCVIGEVAEPVRGPKNPLEIREAKLFALEDVPAELAMGMRDLLDDALANRAVAFE